MSHKNQENIRFKRKLKT